MSNIETGTHSTDGTPAPAPRKRGPKPGSKQTRRATGVEPIAVVKPSARGRGNSTYPWDQLEVGQSFLVSAPRDKEEREKLNKRINDSGYAWSNQKTKGKAKFLTDGARGGIQVWRVV